MQRTVIRRPKCFCVLTFCALALFTRASVAAPISYAFSGALTYSSNQNGNLISLPIQPGAVMTGTFSYDPALFYDQFPSDPNRGVYFSNVTNPFPASATFSVDGYNLKSSSNSSITFQMWAGSNGIFDIQSNTMALSGGWSIAPGNTPLFDISFVPKFGSGFSMTKQLTQMPTLDLSQVGGSISLRFYGSPVTLSFPSQTITQPQAIFLGFQITSLRVVPEPATWKLAATMGCALCARGVAARRWRKRGAAI